VNQRSRLLAGRAAGAVLAPGRGPALALGARIGALPVQIVVTVLSTRLILDRLGVPGYAAFAVVVSLPNLISFAGLGVGAAVTDALARRRLVGDERYHAVLLTSIRALMLSGLVVALAAAALTLTGEWPAVLGVPEQPGLGLGAGVAVALFGLSVPLSIGQSCLLGVHKNHLSIVAQTGGSLVGLGLTVAAYLTHGPFVAYAAAPYLGLASGSVLAVILARRAGALPIGRVARALITTAKGTKIRDLSGAMAVIMVASTVATQSDRLILAHLSSELQVAIYAVAMTLLSAALSFVQAAGMSLWPVFAGQRADGGLVDVRQFRRVTAVFAAGGLVILAGFVLLGPALTEWLSKGLSGSGPALMASCGALALVQSLWWPRGMLLTDADGLRQQAYASIGAAVVNVAVSVATAPHLGAVGPILGTIAGVFVLFASSRSSVRRRLGSRPAMAAPPS